MKIANPIRWVAVLCVAVTSVYIMWMGNKHTNILASPDWCGKALQAEKISTQNFGNGLTSCVDLLKIQLTALARADLVYAGVIALCLLTLIVIVVAGGRVSFKGGPTGVETDIGSSADPVSAAAKQVAGAAASEAQIVTENQTHA